jgi:hypothetical protein
MAGANSPAAATSSDSGTNNQTLSVSYPALEPFRTTPQASLGFLAIIPIPARPLLAGELSKSPPQVASAAASNYTVNISNNGTLTYSGANNQTLSGVISGTGVLTMNSTGNLTSRTRTPTAAAR